MQLIHNHLRNFIWIGVQTFFFFASACPPHHNSSKINKKGKKKNNKKVGAEQGMGWGYITV